MAAEDVFGIVGTTQAGNFHVERVVAEGGFGVVYRALHGGFRAPVALKCLKIPEQMSKQQRDIFLEKFREEAELMFRLSAAITEVCRPLHVDVLHLSDGRFVPFLALEWLEGGSLDGIITRRREQGQPPLGLHKVVKMMRPVAAALARAHRFPGPQGAVSIIHRDLKPENLFVANIGGTESMKILDFGIAKAKRAASQAAGRITMRSLEEDEMASFTPAYGAPEQWSPKTYGETGPWTDVWGLALSMVEALCGSPPIDGEPYVMRRACLDEKRRPTPRAQGGDVPADVEKVFEQALAVDPRKRFKVMEAFWSELEKAMGLPPSLGPRDDRREPGAHSGEDAPMPVKGLPTGERLARIELRKVAAPSRVMPAVKAPDVSEGIPPLKAEPSKEPARARIPPSPAPAPVTPTPSRGIVVPQPKVSEPSSTWEFDLVAGPPVSDQSSPTSAELEMHLPIATDSRPRAETPRVAAPRVEAPRVEAPRVEAPRVAAPRASAELEVSLSLDSDPPRSERTLRSERADRSEGPASSGRRAGGLEIELSADAAPASTRSPRASSNALPNIDRRPTSAASFGSMELAEPNSRGLHAAPAHLGRPMPGTRYVERREPRGEAHHVRRLGAPLGTLLLALAVAGSEIAYHKLTGGELELGPLRPFWIAAPLALFGVGFTLWRLMEVRDDD